MQGHKGGIIALFMYYFVNQCIMFWSFQVCQHILYILISNGNNLIIITMSCLSCVRVHFLTFQFLMDYFLCNRFFIIAFNFRESTVWVTGWNYHLKMPLRKHHYRKDCMIYSRGYSCCTITALLTMLTSALPDLRLLIARLLTNPLDSLWRHSTSRPMTPNRKTANQPTQLHKTTLLLKTSDS